MEVKNKIMYHFHKVGIYDEKWKVGNKIVINDETFFTNYFKTIRNYGTDVSVGEGKRESFDRILNYYIKEDKIKEIDEELLRKMLNTTISIVKQFNIFKREFALEVVRRNKYPNLPSRQHSIWLLDLDNKEFWKKQLLKEDLVLYKVKVSGNLFKSSDSFITDDELTIGLSVDDACNYWEPKFETAEQEEKSEYLFQGELEILEEIEMVSGNNEKND